MGDMRSGRGSVMFVRIATVLLMLVGVQTWLLLGRGDLRSPVALLISLAVGVVVLVFARGWTPTLNLPMRTRLIVAMVIVLITATLLLISARSVHGELGPRYSDEFSYLLQGRMLLSGRLFLPALPHFEHFESWQVIASPAYGSAYFPGLSPLTALLILTGLPTWTLPLACLSMCAGLLYLILAHLFDDLAGLLAPVWIVSLPIAQFCATTLFSAPVALLLGLILIGTTLLWREKPTTMRALLAGAIGGWLLLTRPADAIAFVVPCALLVITHTPLNLRRRCVALALAAIPMLLSAGLQMSINARVSGSAMVSAFDLYTARFYPGAEYGRFDAPAVLRPLTDLEHVQLMYDLMARPRIDAHAPDRVVHTWSTLYLPMLLDESSPHPILLLLAPVGLLAMRRQRWAIALTLPAMVMMLVPYAFVLPHYALTLIPASIVLALCGVEAIARFLPRARIALVAMIGVIAIGQLPQLGGVRAPVGIGRESIVAVDLALEQVEGRAIVLFTSADLPAAELDPVVNLSTADPLAARIIRAHDLGRDRNLALLAWLAGHDPDRAVYRFDRRSQTLTRHGTTSAPEGL
jgi:hypothetical protein